jgi:hypothetical protein
MSADDKARSSAYDKEYYATHLNERKAVNRAWKAAHPEMVKAKMEPYRAEHREQAALARREWKVAHPDSIKIRRKKDNAARRVLGFVPLNQPFDGCEGHHIDQERVVYIPKELHKSVRHSVWTGQNMDKINSVALQWAFVPASVLAPKEKP